MISQRWILLGLLAALTLLGACSADQGEAQKEVATTAAPQGHEDANAGGGPDEHAKDEKPHGDEPAGGHDEHAEGVAALSQGGEKVLAPMALGEELRAPGEVLENAYGTTLITPSIPGLVVKRHARLGDEVKAGTLLVPLSSVEVAQARKERGGDQHDHRDELEAPDGASFGLHRRSRPGPPSTVKRGLCLSPLCQKAREVRHRGGFVRSVRVGLQRRIDSPWPSNPVSAPVLIARRTPEAKPAAGASPRRACRSCTAAAATSDAAATAASSHASSA